MTFRDTEWFFDFAINEQCFLYDDCETSLNMFVEAGKPVRQVEYCLPLKCFCPEAEAQPFSSIQKGWDCSLFAEPFVPCR